MKYLFISHEASATGAPIFFIEFIKELIRTSDSILDIDIIILKDGEVIDQFHELGNVLELFNLDKLELCNSIDNFCGNKKYELAYYNTLETSHILSHIKSSSINIKKNIVHIHEMEGIIQRYGGGKKIQCLNSLSDHIITVSKPVYDNLVVNHNFDKNKMTIIPPFTKKITKLSSTKVESVKKDLNILNKKIILGCGDINARKGVDFFVKLAILYTKNNSLISDELHFLWLGPDSNKEMEFFQKELKVHNAESNMTFLGFHRDTEKFFNTADVFTMVSREDPHPLVCMEAASLEIPIIFFEETGGINSFLNGNGFKANFHDLEDTFTKILTVLNYKEKHEKVIQLKEHLIKNYNIESTTSKIKKYISLN